MPATPVEIASRAARLEIVSAGATIAAAGLILPGEGNLSIRVTDGRCLITPTGADKGRLTAADLLLLDIPGSELPERASSESLLHRRIYQSRPRVGAILHAHPLCVQSLAASGLRPDLGVLVEADWLFSAIGWVKRHPAGSDDLAEAVAEGLASGEACVLDGHGAVTVGKNMAEALRRMMLLERLAAVTAAAARG